jgi:hypothetical protein
VAIVQSLFSERLTQKLHQLVTTRQTGMMRIERLDDTAHPADASDTEQRRSECAEIYLSGGQVVLARSGSDVGVAALARIQSWQQASFTFQEDATIPLQTLDIARQQSILPGRHAIFRAYPAAATPATMKRLARRERIVFALLDGRRSLQDIAHLTHLDDISVARIVVQLYRQGIIEYLQ